MTYTVSSATLNSTIPYHRHAMHVCVCAGRLFVVSYSLSTFYDNFVFMDFLTEKSSIGCHDGSINALVVDTCFFVFECNIGALISVYVLVLVYCSITFNKPVL